MYIRALDNKIYKVMLTHNGLYIINDKLAFDREHCLKLPALTIEELIQDGDMLYIYDLYPDTVLVVEGNIKPFGYNDKITLKEWLEFEHTEFDLYIKDSKDNYIKAAHKEPWEKLELC